jgi:hypothetical protein
MYVGIGSTIVAIVVIIIIIAILIALVQFLAVVYDDRPKAIAP